jgi:hypothetical protein
MNKNTEHYQKELEELGIIEHGHIPMDARHRAPGSLVILLSELYALPESERRQILDELIEQYPPLYWVFYYGAKDAALEPGPLKKPKHALSRENYR